MLAAGAHGRAVAHEAVLGQVGALLDRSREAIAVRERGDVLDAAGPDPHAQAVLAGRAQIAAGAVLEVGQCDQHAADPAPLELGEQLSVHVQKARVPDPRARRHAAEPEAHVLGGRVGLHQGPSLRHPHLQLEIEQLFDRWEVGVWQRVLDHELGDGIALRHRSGTLRRGGHRGQRKDGDDE